MHAHFAESVHQKETVAEAPITSVEALIFDYFCFWNVAAPVESGTSGEQYTPSVHVCTVILDGSLCF